MYIYTSTESTSDQFIAAGGGGAGYQDIEKFKLERKRERNRIAATKCRLVHGQYCPAEDYSQFLPTVASFIMISDPTSLADLTQSIKL